MEIETIDGAGPLPRSTALGTNLPELFASHHIWFGGAEVGIGACRPQSVSTITSRTGHGALNGGGRKIWLAHAIWEFPRSEAR